MLARIDPTLVHGSFAALFGLAVGSFVNVVIHRLPNGGVRALGGRSACPRCGAKIAWFDNLPLVSYLALGGRCRACKAPISARYPVIELLGAALFVAAWWASGAEPSYSPLVVVRWVVLSGLLALSVIDLDLRILPDEITISGMVLGPVAVLAVPDLLLPTWSSRLLEAAIEPPRLRAVALSVAGIAVGAGTVALIRSLGTRAFSARTDYRSDDAAAGERLDAFLARQRPRRSQAEVRAWIDEGHVEWRRGGAAIPPKATERLLAGDVVRVTHVREAMGFGDVKLQGAIGAFVGPEGSLLVLALASFAGAVLGVLNLARVSALVRLRESRRSRRSRIGAWRVARAAGGVIPFGPFLAGGAAGVLLAREPITSLVTDLWPVP